VRVTPIITSDALRQVTIFGTLFGEEDVLISAKIPGRVSEVLADLGDIAGEGATLAKIDPTDYTLAVGEQRAALAASLAKVGLPEIPQGEVDLSLLPEVARARAEEANARSRLDRARLLYERAPPLLSEQDFADIQTQFEVAKTTEAVARLNAESQIAEARVRASSLRTAEQRLADTVVAVPREKPLTFRVAERRVSVGEQVTQGQVLFRIVATDRVKFRGRVPERYAGRLAPGSPATLRLDAPAESVLAAVTRIAPAADALSRTFEVEIEAGNPTGAMKPGSFAHASIEIGSESGVRFVPEEAVVTFAGVSRVYSVREGKAVEHRVSLAPAEKGLHELLANVQGRTGLEEIDAVVMSPGNLRAGQTVRVED
jgi:RND family efflux transporter MFP subunit